MKKIFIVIAMILLVSVNVFSKWQWTSNNAYIDGVEVDSVLLQFQDNFLIFKDKNKKKYSYYWGKGEITERAKVMYSTLLAASVSGKKVSVYFNNVDIDNDGAYQFELVTIHN